MSMKLNVYLIAFEESRIGLLWILIYTSDNDTDLYFDVTQL